MSCYFSKAVLVHCVCVSFLISTAFSAGQGGGEDDGAANAKRLLSDQLSERSQAVKELASLHRGTSRALLVTLSEAKARFRADRRYHSPLHVAILAVDRWNVLQADTILLSIVDYSLDLATYPQGVSSPGDYFFPAASALVRLRVDLNKVEERIRATENIITLRMLTWIVLKRTGSVENAVLRLSSAGKTSNSVAEKRKFERAAELLDDHTRLIPLPPRVVPPNE